jgi:histidine ammonia-lyase
MLLAHDVLETTETPAALGSGTRAALEMIEGAIAESEPRPDAVHRCLRQGFPGPTVGG